MNILNGKITQLRAIEPKDIDLIYQWENNTDIWQISNTLTPFSRSIIKQFIDNAHLDIFEAKQLRLMIDKIDKKPTKTIGTIDLFDFDPFHQRAGVGILIANEIDRQKGYASDALDIIIKYCFSVLQLHQLYCNISCNNTSSIKLFENKGFKLIGTKKDWLLTPQGWKDELMYQRINSGISFKK
ncbi:MAG: GNAT family protein [Bacteroidota bacterium]|nr:GNAT family protein [Bacteroidota bacterium]